VACVPVPILVSRRWREEVGLSMTSNVNVPRKASAALDSAHVGDIQGALGTIRMDDNAPRVGVSAKLRTLVAIIGPGLIVMVGDNDAGAFGTYTQAGQNYGTRLLWTLCCWCRCCM